MRTLTGNKLHADKMLLYAENHNQVICFFLFTRNIIFDLFRNMQSFYSIYIKFSCLLFVQSISGGQSFAEILFGEREGQSPESTDLLLRGLSLHKVSL